MVSAYEPSLEIQRSPRVAKGAPLIGVLPRFVRDPAALLLETSRALGVGFGTSSSWRTSGGP